MKFENMQQTIDNLETALRARSGMAETTDQNAFLVGYLLAMVKGYAEDNTKVRQQVERSVAYLTQQ